MSEGRYPRRRLIRVKASCESELLGGQRHSKKRLSQHQPSKRNEMPKRRMILGMTLLLIAQGLTASSRLSASSRSFQLDERGVAEAVATRGWSTWCRSEMSQCGGGPYGCGDGYNENGVHFYCYISIYRRTTCATVVGDPRSSRICARFLRICLTHDGRRAVRDQERVAAGPWGDNQSSRMPIRVLCNGKQAIMMTYSANRATDRDRLCRLPPCRA